MFAEPPPPPRKAPFGFASFGSTIAFLVGAVVAALGVFITLALFLVDRPFWDDWILNDRAVRTEATALEIREGSTATKTKPSERMEPVMEIHVRFLDKRGRACTAWVETKDETTLATARAHGAIAIEYDPESPSIARVPGGAASSVGLMILLPIALSFFGLGTFLVGLFRVRAAARVYAIGTSVRARVVATVPPDPRGRIATIHYEFPSPNGASAGEWAMQSAPLTGAIIWIVYDSKDPRRNVPSPA